MNLRLSSPLWDQDITFCNLSFWLKDQRWKDKVSKKSPFLLKLVPFTNHRCCCRLIQIFWHLKQLICNNSETISLLKDIINLMKPYYNVWKNWFWSIIILCVMAIHLKPQNNICNTIWNPIVITTNKLVSFLSQVLIAGET